mmetsp:Transcript_554/g.910  ORF Transcript_554/g.910 Transcript_554/m.910 type:complete len:284 (+) Transcript_554:50-901(+)
MLLAFIYFLVLLNTSSSLFIIPPVFITMKGGGKLSKSELVQALNLNSNTKITNGSVSMMSGNVDKEGAVETLADAFKEDPWFVWAADIPQGTTSADKEKTMTKMNKNLFNLMFYVYPGALHLVIRGRNNQVVASMNICPSSNHEESFLKMIMAMFKFGLPPMYKSKEKKNYGPHSRKRLETSSLLAKRRKAHMEDTERWIYLQTIGVRSDQRGQGHGKTLLTALFQAADALKVPVYLETESKVLEDMYKYFGFKTVEVLDLVAPNDESPTACLKMYLMKRDSQ